MKSISGKQLRQLLESRGWELKRITGSHHIYVRADNLLRISLPVHADRALKRGLQKHLTKLAGIADSEL